MSGNSTVKVMKLMLKQCNIKAPQMLFFQQKQISCINCNWQGCPLNYILLLDWAPIAVCLCSYSFIPRLSWECYWESLWPNNKKKNKDSYVLEKCTLIAKVRNWNFNSPETYLSFPRSCMGYLGHSGSHSPYICILILNLLLAVDTLYN